ncbi:MAG: hypothetical protein ABJB55_10665 [Actinomycetota bacterium]
MGIDTEAADPTEEWAGFHELVEGLLEANLEREPERGLRIRRREAAALVATDAGGSVTIRMVPGAAREAGTLLVVDGEDPGADVAVYAASMALLELAGAPLRFGLPDVWTPAGRDVLRQIVTRRIRVRGLVRHLGTVRRLSMLLSPR